MEGLVVLTVATAIATAIVAIVRSLRPGRASPIKAEEGVPTFRLVALGPRGSGKTMLLASMYHQMQTPSGRSYFLTATHGEMVLLNQWLTQVADTGQDWPSGTAVADTREFMFTLRTRTGSGRLHTVMRLGYLEYAGGLLTEPQAPGSTLQAELLQRIESADALLGIIDGYHVRRWLDGHPDGPMRLQHTMTAMIGLMMLAPCPISFVITKWDLLGDIDADENGRLQTVRKLLMSNQGFRDLVQTHSAHRVVRLIPVSAVGPAFAELDAQGVVIKLPDGHLLPTNVDVPLAAVVPDVFEQVERSMDQARLQAVLNGVRHQSGGAALAELGSLVVRTAGRALGVINPLNAGFIADAAAELFGAGSNAANQRRAALERRLTQAEQTIEEFRSARRKVIRELQSRVDVMEGRLPSSRLSGGQ